MHILDVRIDDLNKKNAIQEVAHFLSLPGQYKIFTPNPEMIVRAQEDDYFKQVLNSGDLNLCDGMGVRIFTGIERVPGVDFMLELCQLAVEKEKRIYLLGSGSDEVVHKVFIKLIKKFPSLKIAGYDKGPEMKEGHCEEVLTDEAIPQNLESTTKQGDRHAPLAMTSGVNEETLEKINKAQPDILFVAFGMGKQEKWIYENLAKMPSVKVAMGVGGSFDFIAGKAKRAPLFLRRLGLEWLYRLVQEPKRIGRIFNATFKFIYLYFKSKI